MGEKFKNKYRIESTRLQNWDYRWAGIYFITICTQNREYFLGNVENGKMELSKIGIIADILWYEIKQHFKNIELGEYIVMPNHIHVILILNNNNNTNDNPVGDTGNNNGIDNDNVDDTVDDTIDGVVETLHATSLQSPQPQPTRKNKFMSSISPKPKSVSTIIRSYKSAVTKHVHRLGFDFAWQARFYDHIIRNEKSFRNISEYIIHNPAKWNNDKFNPLNMDNKMKKADKNN